MAAWHKFHPVTCQYSLHFGCTKCKEYWLSKRAKRSAAGMKNYRANVITKATPLLTTSAITSSHARSQSFQSALQALNWFLERLKNAAEQLSVPAGSSQAYYPAGIPLFLGGKISCDTVFSRPFDRVTAVFFWFIMLSYLFFSAFQFSFTVIGVNLSNVGAMSGNGQAFWVLRMVDIRE